MPANGRWDLIRRLKFNVCLWAESIINNSDIIITITGWISTLTCIKAEYWITFVLPTSYYFWVERNESGIAIKRNGNRLIRILKAWGCVCYKTSFHSTRYRRIKNLIHCPHISCNNERERKKDVHHAIGQSATKKAMLISPYFMYWFWRKMHIISENYGT